MTGLALVALFCALLLAVRYVVFPRVENYRDDFAAALTRQLQQPVEIDRIATGWDGWNPKIVVDGLRVRSGANAALPPLVELPRVELIVAWTSVALLDLRLKRLVIEGPRLAVRRDRDGVLHVAGLQIDPATINDDTPITDWVLRQPHIDVRDALIAWNDDLRNAPQLVLDRVQFRLDSRFGRHRFGLRGTPPPELAAPIDVRGDVRVGPGRSWKKATGRIYVRLDYADLAAASEWLPFPVAVSSGEGAIRCWFDFAGGEPTQAVADLALAGVKARLEQDLPELDLATLSGRVGWRTAAPRREYYARGLGFVTRDGQRLDPTNLTVTLRDEDRSGAATGLVEFDRLQLAPARDLLAHLPIPANLRTALVQYAPQGTLARARVLWEGRGDEPDIYSAAADFEDLGVAAQGAAPGVTGLSGHVELTQTTGNLRLASRGATLDLPKVFAKPLAFDSLAGEVNWTRIAERTAIVIERLDFANADAAGRAAGTLRTLPSGPGEIDLDARLTRANATQVWRYIPLVVDPAVRDWLRTSLVKGTSSDTQLKLAGDLARFPFADGKGGRFTVAAKARGVVLDYAPGWPAVSDIDGEVNVTGTALAVRVASGRIADVPVADVRADIADLAAEHPQLVIAGAVEAPTAEFLSFIANSPVADLIAHATDGAQATGNGQLALNLTFPLGDPAGNRIAGEYRFVDNELRLVGVPALSQVNGTLAFTEAGVRAQDLAVVVLGGPARFGIASADGETRVTGTGTATLAALRREFEPPHGDALSGTIDWKIGVSARGDSSAWTLESDLRGCAIDLPAPIGKPSGQSVALKVERRGVAGLPGEDTIAIGYGTIGRVLLHRRLALDRTTVDRVLVLLGRAIENRDAAAERPGVWLRGDLAALNLDDWLAVHRREPQDGGAAALQLSGLDLTVDQLEAFGRRFNAMTVSGRSAKDDWRITLDGRELAGTATWSAPSSGTPNGRLTARLSRLVPPDAGDLKPWRGDVATTGKVEAGAANPWPAIDVVAERYFIRGREVGRLEFSAQPLGAEWRIDRLALTNDGGRLNAEGRWGLAGTTQKTSLDVKLDLTESGKFLSRLGYPDAIKNGPTKVDGKLEWAGAPNDFDYPTLSGAFRIEVGPGRFTKIEPGIGKLLGVLSLQSLPRRITLDFTDVFSDGFAFDEIKGDVRIRDGVLTTDDLRLAGPAAKVSIAGTADLAAESQDLKVRVQPALSASVSAGAMLFLFANPLIGAAVGAGSLLAQKVLRDPIEQMFSYEYKVTGSWSDPVVARAEDASQTADAPRL